MASSSSTVAVFEHSIDTTTQIPGEYDLTQARISIVGHNQCGKTSLLVRWLHDMFNPNLSGMHVEQIYRKKINYDAFCQSRSLQEYQELCADPSGISSDVENRYISINKKDLPLITRSSEFEVQVLDTTNIDCRNLSQIRRLQVKQSNGFILCYNCSDEESFNLLRVFHRNIVAIKGNDVPIVVCCCKIDLEGDRVISSADVADLCDEFDLDLSESYCETSAKENTGTQNLFYTILQKIEKYKQAMRDERRIQNEHVFCSSSTDSEIGPPIPERPSPRLLRNSTAPILSSSPCPPLKSPDSISSSDAIANPPRMPSPSTPTSNFIPHTPNVNIAPTPSFTPSRRHVRRSRGSSCIIN
ncbi:uncharacterized protein Ecym_8233 [Eremothecium cymbalariae DBVPG|uniref:Uncharacterized protein n=1 Tax=Eremothecium cymbalariae (strain CBS 270.75 / DBVPG 7215 / KCTC 17166 / NRRL Y-17582) TaxID=931890 RepID=G8JXE4_ERECY|nr:Hypothetical protein Ecym_8233 [Eremothecium cymbalariae DBVPG\